MSVIPTVGPSAARSRAATVGGGVPLVLTRNSPTAGFAVRAAT
jgi:hypothetical protein